MKRKALVYLLFCGLVVNGYGQEKRYAQLPVNYPSNHFYSLFQFWQNEDVDSAFYFFERFQQKAYIQLIKEREEGYRKAIRFQLALTNYSAGVLAYRIGNAEKARDLTLTSLRQFLTLGDDEHIGLALNSLGVMSADKGDYKSAIRFYHASMKYKERNNDVSGVAHALNNIGVTFRDLGDFEEAKNYYAKSLNLYSSVSDSLGMAVCYNNLGAYFSKNDELDSAFYFYEKALSIRVRHADPGTKTSTLNNLAVVARKEKKLELADSLLQAALRLIEEFPNYKGLAHIKLSMAELDYEKIQSGSGNKAVLLRSAIDGAELAYTIGQQIENPDLKNRTAELLAKLYAMKGDWAQAYQMQSELWNLTKSQNTVDLNRQVLKETFRFEQQKSAEINRLKEENYRNSVIQRQRWSRLFITGVLIALALLLVVLVFIIIQLRRLKEKNQTIQRQNDERELLLKEIHHRVKNNFQIISSLLRLQAQSQERPEVEKAFDEAVHRIHALSLVHEMIYKQQDFTQIETTPYFTRLFSQLEAMNIGNKVRFELNDQIGFISNDLLFPLAIIINELVTNSFKHAFPVDDQIDPVIYLHLFRENELYCLSYADNGIGYDEHNFKQSFGFELIETISEQFSGKVLHMESQMGISLRICLHKEV